MSSAVPDVSIIIVTWNARDHVDRCLAAIRDGGAEGVSYEVLLVDNDSTDGTPEYVRERWPDVRVVETGRNGGMAAGNNAGMLVARGDRFLLLNSDAYLEPGALRALVHRLDTAPERTAAVVPRLRNLDGSPQRSVRGFPTVWRYATEFLGLRKLGRETRAFNAFYGGGLDLARTREIDWATGACLLVPRDAVDEVGLLDEAYFMYGEEVDWFERMRERGRAVVWEPAAESLHVGGGSGARTRGALYQRQLANHVRLMALRHGTRAGRRTQRLIVLALRIRALVFRGERAAAFRAGIAAVRAEDPANPTPPLIPAWDPVERDSTPAR
jgi:GT2 family glycosyltransferase